MVAYIFFSVNNEDVQLYKNHVYACNNCESPALLFQAQNNPSSDWAMAGSVINQSRPSLRGLCNKFAPGFTASAPPFRGWAKWPPATVKYDRRAAASSVGITPDIQEMCHHKSNFFITLSHSLSAILFLSYLFFLFHTYLLYLFSLTDLLSSLSKAWQYTLHSHAYALKWALHELFQLNYTHLLTKCCHYRGTI